MMIKEIIHKGNDIASLMLASCYLGKQKITVDTYEVDWMEYESLMTGQPFYDQDKRKQAQVASVIEFIEKENK